MTDVAGNPEEERRAEFYHQPWSQEAVSRYFYCKVRRGSLDLRTAPSPPPLLPPREASLPSPASGPCHSTNPLTTEPSLGALLPDALPGWPGGWDCPVTHQQQCDPATALISLKIQQRRQELEQSLVVRNT